MQLDKQLQLELEEQALGLTNCIRTLAGTVLVHRLHSAETTLHETRALDVLGRRESWTMTEFAGQLGVTLATASHTADRLVTKRLVKRSRSAQDRRVVLISLSGKSLERQKEILQNRIRICGELLRQLSPAQRKATLAAMQSLAALASLQQTKEIEDIDESA